MITPAGSVAWDSAHDGVLTGSAVVEAGEDRILVVSYADTEAGGDETVTGFSSDLDGAFTRLGSNITSGSANAGIFYLPNPTVGTHVITPAYGDTSPNKPNANIAHWYTGVDQDTPFGTPASATGTTGTTATVTVTDVAEGDLVIDALAVHPARSIAGGDDQTEHVSGGNFASSGSQNIRLGVSHQAGVDGGVMSYTLGSGYDNRAHLAAALKPAASDETAPVLTSPSGTATGETTADLSVDVDEDSDVGVVVTTSSTTPSAPQIVAGEDHTGASAVYDEIKAGQSAGTVNFSATGLSAATTYWAHFAAQDAVPNPATPVTSSSFTTDGGAGFARHFDAPHLSGLHLNAPHVR